MESNFKKYLAYGAGEIVLVVIGILIALQISNWNQTSQERSALTSYLTSTSENIRSDLQKLDVLKDQRMSVLNRTQIQRWDPTARDEFVDRSTLRLASETLSLLSEYKYFRSDQSGFETFKSSGLLKYIQGEDLETLIFSYYILADEILRKEDDYNELLQRSIADFSMQPFEGKIYFQVPDYINGPTQLQELQPKLREILQHPSMLSLFSHTWDRTPELVMRYENLTTIGREIIRLVESGEVRSDNLTSTGLAGVFDIEGEAGYPGIVMNGAMFNRYYEYGQATANDALVTLSVGFEEVTINAPAAPWSAFYFKIRSSFQDELAIRDFSMYETLTITVRGGKGGERVHIAIRDDNDPDDNSYSRYDLDLSSDWETVEIPLVGFETTDFDRVHLPISFVFSGNEQSISVRDIRFSR